MNFLKSLFDTSSFMPHASCYMWVRGLIRLHAISDSLITLSYYSIPVTLVYFVKSKRDLPYRGMFLLFGAFIVACGTTHLMDVVTLYTPLYWISGGIKAITALLSVATAIILIPLVPKALTLRGSVELEVANRQLALEIEGRKRFERSEEDKTSELTAANKELESFSYSVSHDLRAPLRSIDGFSRIVMETQADRLDPEGVEYLRRVCASTKRMGSLIDDLLALSRFTQTEMRRESVNLSALAEEVVRNLQETDPKRHVRFVIAPGLLVQGDARLLQAVLANLLDNALKFTSRRPDAVIEMGVQESNGYPTYYVRDNGAGFDMAYMDQLFGAFHRLHSNEEFPGNGIGLATVQRIIHRHGGKIWAEGEVNRGATFYFALESRL